MTAALDSLRRLVNRAFVRDVIVFTSGTTAAQTLNVLAVPILSRLYDPSVFGAFAIFTSIVSILGLAATGRYEQAIVLPEDESDAAGIMGLSVLLTAGMTVGTVVLIMLAGPPAMTWLKTPELGPWLWLIPPYVFALGLYNSLNYWSTRRGRFRRMSASQVLRAGLTLGTQLILGLLRSTPGGLIGGKVIGQTLSSGILLFQVWRSDGPDLLRLLSSTRLGLLARKHRDFPRYGMPQALLNAVSVSIFPLLIAPHFGPAVVGLYAMTQKVLALPTRLLGESIRQVFYPKASHLANTIGNIYDAWFKATIALLGIGLLPAILILLYGPMLFGFALGPDWHDAGAYARLIVPWAYIGFANPPSVVLFPIMGRQKAYMKYEIISLVSRVCAAFVGIATGDPVAAIAIFSATGCALNLGLILYVMRLARHYVPRQ